MAKQVHLVRLLFIHQKYITLEIILGALIPIAILIFTYYEAQVSEWFTDSYIPIYEILQKDKVIPSENIQYFIQKQNNQVVSQNHDTGEIDTIKNCSIVDRKNWTCKNGSVQIILINGDLKFAHDQYPNYFHKMKPILLRTSHFLKRLNTNNHETKK